MTGDDLILPWDVQVPAALIPRISVVNATYSDLVELPGPCGFRDKTMSQAPPELEVSLICTFLPFSFA